MRILVVPNPRVLEIMREEQKDMPHFELYDLVVQNPKSVPRNQLEEPDYLPHRTDLEHDSQGYWMSLRTFGNIGAKDLVERACRDLAERFRQGIAGAERSLANPAMSGRELVRFYEQDRQNYIHWEGETYTVGHLVAYEILQRQPGISYVAARVEHPLTRALKIVIVHPESTELFLSVCRYYVEVFEDLAKQISGSVKSEPRKLTLPVGK
jgi:DNA-directed RNA polymerase subunit L